MRPMLAITLVISSFATLPAYSHALLSPPPVEDALDYLREHRRSETADSVMIKRLRRALYAFGGAILVEPLTWVASNQVLGHPMRMADGFSKNAKIATRLAAEFAQMGFQLTAAMGVALAAPQGFCVLAHWEDFEERRAFERFLDQDRDQQIAQLRKDPELAKTIVYIADALAHARPTPHSDMSSIFKTR